MKKIAITKRALLQRISRHVRSRSREERLVANRRTGEYQIVSPMGIIVSDLRLWAYALRHGIVKSWEELDAE
jgi:hypothetical protein